MLLILLQQASHMSTNATSNKALISDAVCLMIPGQHILEQFHNTALREHQEGHMLFLKQHHLKPGLMVSIFKKILLQFSFCSETV